MTKDLESLLYRFVSSWPKTLEAAYYRYSRLYQKKLSQVGSAYSVRQGLPYWHSLPGWILRAQGKNSVARNIPKRFLRDVLWGQYCLFFSIRLKDDLFDQQAHDPLLLFVGEQFALEADRAYSEHFGKTHPFWISYRVFLRQTIEGIVEVYELQRRRRYRRRRLLEAYTRVSAIFKIGSVAVCMRINRPRLLPPVQRVLDELAIAGQILDDFMDIAEDCSQNRLNYAASVLFDAGSKGRSSSTDYLGRIAHGFIQTDAEERVFTTIAQHLANALDASKHLALPHLARLILRYQSSMKQIEKGLYHNRVKRIFSF